MNNEAVVNVYSKMKRMAMGLTRTIEDGEDLCHDVATQLLCAKLPQDLHGGWIFAAVKNRSISNYRKECHKHEQYQLEDTHSFCHEAVAGYEIASPAVNDVCDRAEYSLLIDRLKTQLNEAQLLTLVLIAYGADYKDIATLTGVSIGTVRSRLHFARQKAKEALGSSWSLHCAKAN